METSVLLARIIGPLFILIGVGVLLNRKHYAAMATHFLSNAELYYFSGALAFILGIVMVLYHNIWTADWRVIITIIGWLSLFKGVVRILSPTMGSAAAASFTRSQLPLGFSAVVLLIVGGWLSFEGFRV